VSDSLFFGAVALRLSPEPNDPVFDINGVSVLVRRDQVAGLMSDLERLCAAYRAVYIPVVR